MKGLESFLFCLSLEIGVVFMVVFDVLHVLYHFFEFLPSGSGKEIYIYYECFDIDADLFLFYSTNVALLIIKTVYGIKVIQRKFKQYTSTYHVLTTLVSLLVSFLDFALSAYLANEKSNWYGFIFAFCFLLISIYFIMLTKALSKKVAEEKEVEDYKPDKEDLKEDMLQDSDKESDEGEQENEDELEQDYDNKPTTKA